MLGRDLPGADSSHFELKQSAIAQVAEGSTAGRVGALGNHGELVSPCGWRPESWFRSVQKLYLTLNSGIESGEFCIFHAGPLAIHRSVSILPPRSNLIAHKREKFQGASISSGA